MNLTTLASGVRVITERMPEARSVTVGFWVGVGGRDEPGQLAGASHFLEHLLFKGSARREARGIAEAVEAVGGEMNAFTSREHTAFYLRLPAAHLDFGLSLLAEVVAEPALRADEVDAEREVILEELLGTEDAPDELVHQALDEALFPQHPLGREVLGTEATIEAMTRDDIAGFHAGWYLPANLVVAAAGCLEHVDVAARLEAFLTDGPAGAPPERIVPSVAPSALSVLMRPTEQAHLAMGWRAFGYEDPDRYALAVANQALGGGMASRLFQEVRENRGLAYNVYSYVSLNDGAGELAVYAGTAPTKVKELLAVVDDEVGKVKAGGFTEREIEVARGYLEGSFLLGLEDSGARMVRLGRGIVDRGAVVSVQGHVERLRAVDPTDVARVVERVLGGPRALAAVGPFDEATFSVDSLAGP